MNNNNRARRDVARRLFEIVTDNVVVVRYRKHVCLIVQ